MYRYFIFIIITSTTLVMAKTGNVVTHKHNNRTHSHPLPAIGVNHSHNSKSNRINTKNWASLAFSSDGAWGLSVSKPNKQTAEQFAIKECRMNAKETCKIIGTLDQVGYVSVATSKKRVRAEIRNTAEAAEQAALNSCARDTRKNDICKVQITLLNGTINKSHTSISTTDCRPRTAHIRCKSNCYNGNCVVEYENGCKIKVKVKPRLDPFSNQWTYPSPSC